MKKTTFLYSIVYMCVCLKCCRICLLIMMFWHYKCMYPSCGHCIHTHNTKHTCTLSHTNKACVLKSWSVCFNACCRASHKPRLASGSSVCVSNDRAGLWRLVPARSFYSAINRWRLSGWSWFRFKGITLNLLKILSGINMLNLKTPTHLLIAVAVCSFLN